MRTANLLGRLVLLGGSGALDVEQASHGRFDSDPQQVFEQWAHFIDWAATADLSSAAPYRLEDLGSPAPRPRQVIAIGLNYSEHATETGHEVPASEPPVFTKFPTCITGPYGTVVLPPGGHTDWEVELVVVIGERAQQVAEAKAWNHVAGLSVGQDISERLLQMAAPSKQFSLGKSYAGFGPIGPHLVTLDGMADPADLELGCSINGEVQQRARTSQMIFSVPELIARLSAVMPLLPGDVIFSGTPAGVGLGREIPRWLQAGDELVSWIEGIGEIKQRFVATDQPAGEGASSPSLE